MNRPIQARLITSLANSLAKLASVRPDRANSTTVPAENPVRGISSTGREVVGPAIESWSVPWCPTPEARGRVGLRALLRPEPSSCCSLVSMMQPANFGQLEDSALLRQLRRSRLRRIACQRLGTAGPVVVLEVTCQDPDQVHLAENDHVIEALPAE